MHFALVIPELHKRGGTERCTADLAEALVRRGHRFTIFAHHRDRAVLPGSRWHRVPMLPRPHLPRFFSFLVAQTFARALARMRGERFDLVLCTGPDVLRPHISVFHCSAAAFAELATDESQQVHASKLSRVRRWTSRLTYRAIACVEEQVASRGAQRAIAISNHLKNEFGRLHGAHAAQMKVLPDGVDLLEFYPRGIQARLRVRRELDIEPQDKAVLFVGHNWLRKGLPTLAKAIARDEDDRLVLVVAGMGDKQARSEISEQLGTRVRFVGTWARMAELYAAADVLVLPTLHEPFGLPVLEAMACGLPVIVSRSAGVAELITHGIDGLLLSDPRDPAEVAQLLRRLLVDSLLRQTLAANARHRAQQFSWDALAADFEAIADDAARRPRR
jgi:glycosyltransferase involved in cell wall biosynthesis